MVKIQTEVDGYRWGRGGEGDPQKLDDQSYN